MHQGVPETSKYHVGGHGAQGQARMQLKAITREDCVDAYCGCTFFSGFWMYAYSLDMWMFNFIIHEHINYINKAT